MINLKPGSLDPKPVFFTTTFYYHIPSAVAQSRRDLEAGGDLVGLQWVSWL